MDANKIKFDIKLIKYPFQQGGEIFKTEAVQVVLKDFITGEEYPHPITHFFYEKYHRNSGSINTELGAAFVIVPFLNYIFENVGHGKKEFIGLQGLAHLNYKHANLFLKHCVEQKGNKNETLKRKENYLSKFYMYLWDEGILEEKPPFKIVTIKTGDEVKTIYKMKFTYKKTNEVLLREKIKRKDIIPSNANYSENKHLLRLHYIREILLIAKQEVEDIAFAVALQIFGGLRKGGIVNLVQSALISKNGSKYGEEGLVVKVRDRQKTLFARFDATPREQVKNPRDQSCLIDPILCYLYKHHMEVVLKKVKRPTVANALFYDTNGNPMSGDTFEQRFLKLKNIYLGMLLGTKGRYQEYLDFSETKWRSHIGRGVFTNMCMDAGYNEKQTAVLRGDKSTKSMEAYFDIITATFNIRKALGLLTPENESEISNLNMPVYQKNWKDVQNFVKSVRK